MNTTLAEIGPGIFRFSTYFPDLLPGGFTFNQFLLHADEPLLFHAGMRGLFPSVSDALKRVVPLERLRWVSFGHVEADESGAMNHWLAASPRAEVVHGHVACMVSLNDLADRPPRPLGEGERLDLGGRTVRLVETPHVPHGWESILLFEETTRTLFCGDLFTHAGNGPPVTDSDILGAAMDMERAFPGATALTPTTGATLRRLAALEPQTLALMHGSSFHGDGGTALRALADAYDGMHDAAERANERI